MLLADISMFLLARFYPNKVFLHLRITVTTREIYIWLSFRAAATSAIWFVLFITNSINPLAFSGNMNHSSSAFFYYWRLYNKKVKSISLRSRSLIKISHLLSSLKSNLLLLFFIKLSFSFCRTNKRLVKLVCLSFSIPDCHFSFNSSFILL